jgi:hypothetical protein
MDEYIKCLLTLLNMVLKTSWKLCIVVGLLLISLVGHFNAAAQGVNDTIFTSAVIYYADTIPAANLPEIEVIESFMDPDRKAAIQRLRYHVNKVYPYAITASYLWERVEQERAVRTKRKDQKKYLKSLEEELKSRFKDELKDLTMTQGQILVKLINRQTGRDCYSIIKEIKGGLNARIFQIAAGLYNNDLKKQYDPYGDDKDIEMIVQEIEAKNYYKYQQQILADKAKLKSLAGKN